MPPSPFYHTLTCFVNSEFSFCRIFPPSDSHALRNYSPRAYKISFVVWAQVTSCPAKSSSVRSNKKRILYNCFLSNNGFSAWLEVRTERRRVTALTYPSYFLRLTLGEYRSCHTSTTFSLLCPRGVTLVRSSLKQLLRRFITRCSLRANSTILYLCSLTNIIFQGIT